MEVPCEFSFDGCSYKCFIYDVQLSESQQIKEFLGEHCGRRSNSDVNCVSFINCGIKSFPRNLTKFFPNLNVLEMISCGLSELTKYDLIGYPKLVYLGIVENQLRHLPSDLFEYTPEIMFVDFSCNQITSIGSRIFDSLKELRHANLSHNRKINVLYEEQFEPNYEELINAIKENCRPMESLKGLAASILTENLSDENAAEIFIHSCRFDLVGLRRKSFLYLKDKVLPWLDESMLERPEKLVKLIAKRKLGWK